MVLIMVVWPTGVQIRTVISPGDFFTQQAAVAVSDTLDEFELMQWVGQGARLRLNGQTLPPDSQCAVSETGEGHVVHALLDNKMRMNERIQKRDGNASSSSWLPWKAGGGDEESGNGDVRRGE